MTAASGTAAAGDGREALLGNCLSDLPQEAGDGFPTIDLTDEDVTTSDVPDSGEFVIFIHGWLEYAAGGGENQAATFEAALEQNGYDEPVVAALWDSNTLNWWDGKESAEEAGRRLADWIDEHRSGCDIRTVGHSLGGRASFAMLDAIETELLSVSTVGAASNPDTVCADGKWGDGIADAGAPVYNFHSRNDEIVCRYYKLLELTSAVGCEGADCDGLFSSGSPPDNYADVDVSKQVRNHCDYFRPDVGCVPQIVERFDGDGDDAKSDRGGDRRKRGWRDRWGR